MQDTDQMVLMRGAGCRSSDFWLLVASSEALREIQGNSKRGTLA